MIRALAIALLVVAACHRDAGQLADEQGTAPVAASPQPGSGSGSGPGATAAERPQPVEPSAPAGIDQAAFEADLAALQSVASRVLVTLPSETTWTERLPTVFWFHGYGWHPGFVEEARVQQWADTYGLAFIGVSATNLRVAARFDWAEVDADDFQRVSNVRQALFEHGPFDPEQVVATGFSQGGALAVRLLASAPDQWRGAIALSPGAVHHRPALGTSNLTARRAVLVAGASERRSIVNLAREYDEQLRERGAAVDLQLIDGMSRHTFPPQFDTLYPMWIQAVLAQGGLLE